MLWLQNLAAACRLWFIHSAGVGEPQMSSPVWRKSAERPERGPIVKLLSMPERRRTQPAPLLNGQTAARPQVSRPLPRALCHQPRAVRACSATTSFPSQSLGSRFTVPLWHAFQWRCCECDRGGGWGGRGMLGSKGRGSSLTTDSYAAWPGRRREKDGGEGET